MREKIARGEISPSYFYRELLQLIYRLLFIMVAEERDLIQPEDLKLREIYDNYYGLSRLRAMSAEPEVLNPGFHDLWEGVKRLFYLLSTKDGEKLGLTVLNGGLFQWENFFFKDYKLSNADFLKALNHLSYFEQDGRKIRVNYAALDVEELGSVYESLLDYQPVFVEVHEEISKWSEFSLISAMRDMEEESGIYTEEDLREKLKTLNIKFDLIPGTERKSTGSYYTPPALVQELIKSALEPVLEERLKKASTREEKERAILDLKVCDPACGSGHFLLAAARRLGFELARVRTGEEHPSVDEVRHATREVIQHCLYGVDKNPLAVDLCKVALWLEGACRGEPLTFLDHRIKCGDSLVGVFDFKVLEKGIPDEAFKPLEGDDRKVCRELAKKNKRARTHFGGSSLFNPLKKLEELSRRFQELEDLPDRTLEELKAKAERYREITRSEEWWILERACNLWTAAFFMPKTAETQAFVPTSEELFRYLERPKAADGRLIGQADALAEREALRFFHWPLEFPEVFARGGFDVVLGNPPWEKIKLQEKEFFVVRAPEIANAANRAARQKLIKKLKEENPALYREFLEAKRNADATSLFLRASGRFPLTARGDINTYSVFAELALRLTCPEGRAGIIVPTGIATDDTNKQFFSHLMENGFLASLYDFENREGIFPAVHRSYKFSLLTLYRSSFATRHSPEFVFFATRVEHLKDKQRRFTLTAEDIACINPNTRTTPIFRTSYDAELTKKIYRRVPVLVNEKTGENPWGVRFLRMFDMSNDSHLFRTRKELFAAGYELKGNIFVKANGDVYLPLYEAKFVDFYDHRFGSYETRSEERGYRVLPQTPLSKYQNACYVIQPWYWVSFLEVKQRLVRYDSQEGLLWRWIYNWLLSFRNITSATNERTAIFSLIPLSGVGHSTPLLFVEKIKFSPCLLANLSSMVFDYVTRQKVGGTNFTFHYVKQLPVLPPETYTTRHLLFAIPRIMELVYTAWDMKPFADDIWAEADQELRAAIRKQWEENARETGGHGNATPPEWLEIIYSLNPDNPNQDACPLPPFKWNEERRARLRAELDALFAKLYGLTEEELRYTLDPQDVFGPDFPGETFRVLEEKEIRQFGEYRTKRLVLEAWENLKHI
ncbi:N-6 DNA methylase [Thermosulfurimonas sp. F29]|uniref:Eco57I restriction-modification methylase domain-containing protein n=1 Tax=Thermosulfurimonas sp. F29 TaxID=2867247 RepID=UPI001C8320FF|nr:N-6 DNA methylase [Thermosulfurimonas sp. F29]MBX6422498.1 N-6 DNA methylase [Thermosulfurimonas sp. F29]